MDNSEFGHPTVETQVSIVTRDEHFACWNRSRRERLHFGSWFAGMVRIGFGESMAVAKKYAVFALDGFSSEGAYSFDQHYAVVAEYNDVFIGDWVTQIITLVRKDSIALIEGRLH